MDKRYDRVILLIDMDSFYCQVEEQLNPALKGRPSAVVQYNAWQGGGIIAVNYLARAKGVTRHMRGDEAKKMCPDIELVRVNSVHGKADLSKYRDAGQKVAEVMSQFQGILERASVDEAYMDISIVVNQRIQSMNSGAYVLPPQQLENTFVPGYQNFGKYASEILSDYMKLDFSNGPPTSIDLSNLRLLVGAALANEIRAAIKRDTGYECSAGIAHNKILAKLACGLNKPNKQTILPLNQIPKLFDKLPIRKLRGLGGKFGEDVCSRCNVTYIGELRKYTELELQQLYDAKYGSWLFNICRGIDLEPVKARSSSQSIGCCKKFPGRNKLADIEALQHWLLELSSEIQERLEKDINMNNRRASHLILNMVLEVDSKDVSVSRSRNLPSYDADDIAKSCMLIIKENMVPLFRPNSQKYLTYPLKYLGISVGKFTNNTNATTTNTIKTLFQKQITKEPKKVESSDSIERIERIEENNTNKSNEVNVKANETVTGNDEDESAGSYFLQVLKQIQNESREKRNSLVTERTMEICDDSLKERSSFSEESTEQITSLNETENVNSAHLLKEENSNLNHSDANNSESIEKTTNEHVEGDHSANTTDIANTKLENDYNSEYIELALPKYNPELLKYVKCSICDKEILDNEITIQTHKDYHYALELNQQQREEYRQQIKMRAKQNSDKSKSSQPSKKAKHNNTKESKYVHITKYFQKQDTRQK